MRRDLQYSNYDSLAAIFLNLVSVTANLEAFPTKTSDIFISVISSVINTN